jgi:hypothetical protein
MIKKKKTPMQIFPDIIRKKTDGIQLKNSKIMVYLNDIPCNKAKWTTTKYSQYSRQKEMKE